MNHDTPHMLAGACVCMQSCCADEQGHCICPECAHNESKEGWDF